MDPHSQLDLAHPEWAGNVLKKLVQKVLFTLLNYAQPILTGWGSLLGVVVV